MKKRENISKLFLEEKKKEEQESKKKIMKEIENNTQKKVLEKIQSGQITNPILEKDMSKNKDNSDILQNILKDGANAFTDKMGRNMTYSEMREMFG